MEKITLNLTDLYEVSSGSILTDYDRKVLVRLYQPIIGTNAIGLYFTLWSELEGERTITTYSAQLSRLIDILKISIKEYNYALEQLEMMGLVKTYYNKVKEIQQFVYKLKAPLTPYRFFEYELFHMLFKNAVSKIDYERTRLYFDNVKAIKAEFKEITKPFDATRLGLDLNNREIADLMKLANNTPDRSTSKPILSFDFDLFYQGLKEYQISKRSITKAVEEEIRVLSHAYNISVFDMRNLVVSSLDKEGLVDIFKLKARAKEFIPLQTSNHVDEKINMTKSGNDKIDAKIELLSKLTPIEFLTLKYNNQRPVYSDIKLIENLVKETKLPNPVINVLIDYVLFKNNNRLTASYIMKIAGSLMRENIKDVYETMVFLNNPIKTSSTAYLDKDETPTKASLKTETKEKIVEQDLTSVFAELNAMKKKGKSS
jgi:replication initiation and membrane attachment protein